MAIKDTVWRWSYDIIWKNSKTSYAIAVVVRIPDLILGKDFFLDEPFIAPSTATAALSCIDSIF